MFNETLPDDILPDGTTFGAATLRVTDLARALRFYHGILGLKVFESSDTGAALGGGKPFLRLEGDPEAVPHPVYSTGLYHLAILLPSRRALAEAVVRLVQANYLLQGTADHGVSEAYYLTDPDANGLELYCDRPRSAWRYRNGRVEMGTEALDEPALFRTLRRGQPVPEAVPADTRLGHLHLKVHRIDVAEAFYGGVLGFEETLRMPGALFMSVGGYHHHLGFNTWQSAGAARPPAKAVGLRRFSLLVPASGLLALEARLGRRGVAYRREGEAFLVEDPWGQVLELRPA